MSARRFKWLLCTTLAVRLQLSSANRVSEFIGQATHSADISLLNIRYEFCPDDWLHSVLWGSAVPVLLLSLWSAKAPHEMFPRQVLHVVCLPGSEEYQRHWLAPLAETLQNKRTDKLIFYLTTPYAQRHKLQALLQHCEQLKMLNVLAFVAANDSVYYSFNPYPEFTVEQHVGAPQFSEKFPNMMGARLVVMPDQAHPRSIIYKDKKTNELIMAGSVGRFVHTLAWKLNATLQFAGSIKIGEILHYTELQTLAQQLPFDLPVGLVRVKQPEHLRNTSYPFEQTSYCLLVPRALELQLHEIYPYLSSATNVLISWLIALIFSALLLLHRCLVLRLPCRVADLLLNDAVWRGLLGLPYNWLRPPGSLTVHLLVIILGVVGINIGSVFHAMLGSMLTRPPFHFQPRSYAQVQAAPYALAIIEKDAAGIEGMPLQLHKVSSKEFYHLRDSFNVSYVYFCSRIHWMLFDQQQKYFAHDVFIYATESCSTVMTVLSFQLPNNSWFAEPLKTLMLETRANGIYQYWLNAQFFDMTAAGLITFKDLSPPRRQDKVIHLYDLIWVWYFYVSMIGLASLFFTVEYLYHRFARRH